MSNHWGKTQVNKEHYFSQDYLSKARFIGLYGQVNSCLNYTTGGKILEIGPGPGLFYAVMKRLDFDVFTIDFDRHLSANVIGRIPELPLVNKSFDVVCAFEVLEHIPFELLGICLQEMSRISNSLIIFSVPNINFINPEYKFQIELKIKNRYFKKEYFSKGQKTLTNPKEHYWELGINDINEKHIINAGENIGLKILSQYFLEPWFHFFIFSNDTIL